MCVSLAEGNGRNNRRSGKAIFEGMNASVISLVERRAAAADPVLNQVEAYWDGLRAGRNAPSRAEVSPRGLTDVLSRCFILERIAPGFARFRVFGRHVGDLMGGDLRNMPLSALFFAEDREILEETLIQVFDRPATARLAIESPPGLGRERLTCRMSLLPLRDDLGQMNRMLGAISVEGRIGRAPRKLTITGKTLSSIPQGNAMKLASGAAARRANGNAGETGTVVHLKLPAD